LPVRAWSLPACCLALWAAGACNGPQEPVPPGGGHDVALDYGVFVATIEPILQQRGCSNLGCHGGQGSGELLLSGGASPSADFLAVSGHVTPWDPPQSPLLRKPLAEDAGGAVHAGGEIFLSASDPDYVAILDWITPEATP
jgi:hypothetical protein